MCGVVWGEGWCSKKPEKRNEEKGIRSDRLCLGVLSVILKSALIHNKIYVPKKKTTTTNVINKIKNALHSSSIRFVDT